MPEATYLPPVVTTRAAPTTPKPVTTPRPTTAAPTQRVKILEDTPKIGYDYPKPAIPFPLPSFNLV